MRSSIANRNRDIDIAGPSRWHLLPPGADPIAGPKIFQVLEIFLNGDV
jgi:hypothetical protein